MKKQKLNELKQLQFGKIEKDALSTLKGGDGPLFTRERTWEHYDCPDIEFD